MEKSQASTTPRLIQKINDVWLIILSLALLTATVLTAFAKLYCCGYGCVLIVNIYIIMVLIIAAMMSDKSQSKTWLWDNLLPSKKAGLLIFIFLLFSTTLGFAEIFVYEGIEDNMEKSFYHSFITITSFDYKDYSEEPLCIKMLQIWQSLSAILLISGAFGLLLSRVSDYKEKINP